ncbi:MAG: M20/M25/M40 family metallo-hydrolase, partial [Chloroflexia bacterium]|nr:M20/M25/M40 family metallo-hydrolase [Chloroflexia bacterium]
MATHSEILEAFDQESSSIRRWRQIRAGILDVITNLPLLLGVAMVAVLILVAIYAPLLAPRNPFETRALMRIDGELQGAPFEPSETFLLGSDARGRDILSMLLYGARQTLVIGTVVVAARLVLGCVVGALAGWFTGSRFDRIAMAAADFSAAFPPLILGAILVFLFDIRKGMISFALALCFIGWGEIAQYVRSEFMVVRGQPYIEGARGIGLSEIAVIFRHAVPNVITSLIVLTALEMSAVLLLMGELGFLGIYVGGGTAAADRPTAFFDVPEWGGMLAGSWRYVRNKYWIPLYPALAFAFAILGFNLFGEGLRRLVEKGRVPISTVYSRRSLAVVALLVLSTMTVMNNIGPQAQQAHLAARFDERSAFRHIEILADKDLQGRPAGSAYELEAAEYIAAEMQSLGLLPAGDDGTYFQTFPISYTYLLETPQLEIVDANGNVLQSYVHREDFREIVSGNMGAGQAESREVVLVVGGISFKPGDKEAGIRPDRDDFRGVDVRGKIVLLVPDAVMPLQRSVAEIYERGGLGVLVPGTEDTRYHMKGSYIIWDDPRGPKLPTLLVSPQVADRLLSPQGRTQQQIREQIEAILARGEVPKISPIEIGISVRMSVQLAPYETRTSQNVLGYLPGSDPNYDWQIVILCGHYDHIAPDPNGTLYPGANDNASGVAVVLEVARLFQEVGYEPKQTVLFAAWGSEEIGLLGSRYYTRHPQFAPQNTIAVLNL